MKRLAIGMGLGGAWMLLTGLVPAQDAPIPSCASDADCPAGTVCEVVGAGGCAVPDCQPDADCDLAVACDPVEIFQCVPGPCQVDADCPAGTKCAHEEYGSCSNVAVPSCPPEADCGEPPPPQEPACETKVISECRMRWEGNCSSDAECGPGFACQKAEICTCQGAAPSMEPGAGAEYVPPADPICDCQYDGTAYCQPLELPCDSDSDCGDGLSCQVVSAGVTCTSAPLPANIPEAGAGDAGVGDAGAGDAGAGDAARAAPCVEETVRWCLPPGYVDGATPTRGGVMNGTDNTGGEVSFPQAPAPTPTMTPTAAAADANAADDAEGAGLFCSALPGRAVAGAPLWLLALPLSLWLRRRRGL